MRLAVVVPFLNEAEVLGRLLSSLRAQERLPDRLLLVDDGSDDDSFRLAAEFAEHHAYATALQRPRQPRSSDRLARASELLAFQWAVPQLDSAWDVVAKLDADLELPPCALRHLLDRLEEDATLGIAGTFLSEHDEAGVARRVSTRERHVHGATKFYRRACFEQIAPIPPILGWDTIDELTAQMHGWTTRSFGLPGGDPLHLRPRGAYDGLLRAHRRWGECAYAFGEPLPVTMLLAARDARDGRRTLGPINYVAGWVSAALRRQPRAATDVRAFVRRAQYGRVRDRLAGRRR